MTEVPARLLDAFRHHQAAVFVGSGASIGAGMPSWAELVTPLARDLGLPLDEPMPLHLLAAIPQYYLNLHGRGALIDRVRRIFPPSIQGNSIVHQLLSHLPCSLFYTTNLDHLLERALESSNREFVAVASEGDARDHTDRSVCQVRKIHGSLDDQESIVITREDFAQFAVRHPVLTAQLASDLSSMTFLFVGYSLSDPNIGSVFDEVLFRLGRGLRRHFFTVIDANEHALRDLVQRGLLPIDLEPWGGRHDGLIHFLRALCDETSDAVHIRRFFSSVDSGGVLPVVVPSVRHARERYSYYPEMDIHVFEAIGRGLAQIGATASLHADHAVLPDAANFLTQDVLLVGSPRGNGLTNFVLEHVPKVPNGTSGEVSFLSGDERALIVQGDGRYRFPATDPSFTESEWDHCEYALIAKLKNPWAPERWLWVMAGLWALGTSAIAAFLSDLRNYRQLPWAPDEDGVGVLEISYRSTPGFELDHRSQFVVVRGQHRDDARLAPFAWS